jgi:NADH dehydrogenase
MDIDPQSQKVLLADGDAFPYNTLIIATGSQTSYYGNDQWRENAPSLKSVEEATRMRHKLLYAFERAERSETEAEERAWLTFVIVGAGATGLELAGAEMQRTGARNGDLRQRRADPVADRSRTR